MRRCRRTPLPLASRFMSSPSELPQRAYERPGGAPLGLRSLVEGLVCLAIAVIVFRAFQVEGYMISTGSMAPSLLGFHKQVRCPTCGTRFEYGVAYDESVAQSDASDDGRSRFELADGERQLTVCPNCGQSGIDITRVPRNQGDQLLVHKPAYLFERPHRWEIIVFRNPAQPTEAYVKRVAGLPGEAVQVIDGDLYANDAICRKDLATQRAMRIPVYDYDRRPRTDPDWQPRWRPTSGWQTVGPSFTLGPAALNEHGRDHWHWIEYHHWIRAGGRHETSVLLPVPSEDIQLPSDAFLQVQYHPDTRRLSRKGVLPDVWKEKLLAAADEPDYRRAIQRLADESHFAPITDEYGYNHAAPGVTPVVVRDLMLEAEVTIERGRGELAVEMTDGKSHFRAGLDLSRRLAWLDINGQEVPVARRPLPADLVGRPIIVEMSIFDRQILLAVDGQLAFDPWPLTPADLVTHDALAPELTRRKPVRIGARGLEAHIAGLRLYRDVHYTRGRARNGVDTPCQLGPHEYFVLGDNSPVSSDSRNWIEGTVPESLLLGKPFLVHLPSKPGQLRIGRTTRHVRIPDISRIRYIR